MIYGWGRSIKSPTFVWHRFVPFLFDCSVMNVRQKASAIVAHKESAVVLLNGRNELSVQGRAAREVTEENWKQIALIHYNGVSRCCQANQNTRHAHSFTRFPRQHHSSFNHEFQLNETEIATNNILVLRFFAVSSSFAIDRLMFSDMALTVSAAWFQHITTKPFAFDPCNHFYMNFSWSLPANG